MKGHLEAVLFVNTRNIYVGLQKKKRLFCVRIEIIFN